MAETSIFWLRIAALLYSLGLIHAFLTVAGRREHMFRVALGAFLLGSILHLVSLVDEAVITNHFPANNVYESLSLCSFLIALLFLFVYWRYRLESLGVVIFPLVFVMALVATLTNRVPVWGSKAIRDTWLTVHVVAILLGYAALLFTAVAALLYLVQERELKRRKPRNLYYRLPPLGTLDDLISKSMGVGFVFLTLGIVIGSTWAFVELGTSWIREPKIGISVVTWLIYLTMVFLRVTAGWRGRKAAVISIIVLISSALTWAAHVGLKPLLEK